MAESIADLIIHPIRIRIIQSLVGGFRRTTQEISEIMPDIPQATMYRHLNKLLKAKVLEIVEHKQVRGSIEKVYILAELGAEIPAKDLLQMNADEHMEMFMKFIALLIGDYDRYLKQEQLDLEKDGVSFRQVALNLSDEEYRQLLMEMRATMQLHLNNEASDERTKRVITTIVIPEIKQSKKAPH
jgi:DNA-binding transcriptional ArsR family regulator